MKTLSLIEGIMRDIFDNQDINITKETNADDVKEWDSLNHVRLIVEIELQLGIQLPTDKINELKSVGELVSLVQANS